MMQPRGPVADQDLIALRVREHLAFDALTTWQGNESDLHTLLVSLAVAHELVGMGIGADQSHGLATAAEALQALRHLPRGLIGLPTPQRCEAVRWLLGFHDAQRQAATYAEYHRALSKVRAAKVDTQSRRTG